MRTSFLLGGLFFWAVLWGQEDCYLCVGSGTNSIIVEVFELDSLQRESLENLSAELSFLNKMLEDRARYMLLLHEQSAPEDLLVMSFEYRSIIDSMQMNVRNVDRKLLEQFDDEQYNRYINLCNKVKRSPLFARRPKKKKKDSK